jgi:hypothetical protein
MLMGRKMIKYDVQLTINSISRIFSLILLERLFDPIREGVALLEHRGACHSAPEEHGCQVDQDKNVNNHLYGGVDSVSHEVEGLQTLHRTHVFNI